MDKVRSGPGRPAQTDRDQVGIRSAELALDVLDVLTRSTGPLGLTEIARLTAMAPSKLHRYLVSLVRRRMVVQHASSGLYDLGPAALALGAIALTRFDGFDLVQERVKALSVVLGFNTFVYVWTESGPVLIRSHTASHSAITLRIGSTVPLVSSATGPVFAAFLPEPLTREILARDVEAAGGDVADTIRALTDTIGPAIRSDMVYWSKVSILPHAAACAAPVFDMQGELFCVLGVGIPDHAITPQSRAAVTAAVRQTASAVSVELGHAHPSP